MDSFRRALLHFGRLDWPHCSGRGSRLVCRQRRRALRAGVGGFLRSPRRASKPWRILQHYCADLAAATDLALAIREAGYRLVQEPACVTTATGELLASGAPGMKALPANGFSCVGGRFPAGAGSATAHALLMAGECMQAAAAALESTSPRRPPLARSWLWTRRETWRSIQRSHRPRRRQRFVLRIFVSAAERVPRCSRGRPAKVDFPRHWISDTWTPSCRIVANGLLQIRGIGAGISVDDLLAGQCLASRR